MINDHLLVNKSDFRNLCKKRLTFIGNVSGYIRNKNNSKKITFFNSEIRSKKHTFIYSIQRYGSRCAYSNK